MRDIKFFRGKKTQGGANGKHWSSCAVYNMPAEPNGQCDCGLWAYGNLEIDTDKNRCFITGFEYDASHKGIDRKPFRDEVEPSTVGRLMGGTKFYEHDILKSPYGICVLKHGEYTEYVTERVHEVLVTIYPNGWYLEYTTGEQAGWSWGQSPGYFERIGNTTDNPELLRP
jgi:hypothetical protein